MGKLKECPFCGNKYIKVDTDYVIENLDEGEGSGFYAVCCSVNANGCGSTGGYKENKEDAIKNWNQRI